MTAAYLCFDFLSVVFSYFLVVLTREGIQYDLGCVYTISAALFKRNEESVTKAAMLF